MRWLFLLLMTSALLASSEPDCPEYPLKVRAEDGEKIGFILEGLATRTIFSLIINHSQLEKWASAIDDSVRSFEFLSHIFLNTSSIQYMKMIQKQSIKYGYFVEGAQRNIMAESEERCFFAKVKSFIALLKLDEERVMTLLKEVMEEAEKGKNKRAFKPFIDYLIASSG